MFCFLEYINISVTHSLAQFTPKFVDFRFLGLSVNSYVSNSFSMGVLTAQICTSHMRIWPKAIPSQKGEPPLWSIHSIQTKTKRLSFEFYRRVASLSTHSITAQASVEHMRASMRCSNVKCGRVLLVTVRLCECVERKQNKPKLVEWFAVINWRANISSSSVLTLFIALSAIRQKWLWLMVAPDNLFLQRIVFVAYTFAEFTAFLCLSARHSYTLFVEHWLVLGRGPCWFLYLTVL